VKKKSLVARDEFLRYHGLQKEQTNSFDKYLKIEESWLLKHKTMENEVFWAHKTP
jgi:hypothetical protein